MYNTGKIEDEKDRTLAERIIRNVVDIDDNSNIGYDNLYRDILKIKTSEKGMFFYSSNEIQKAFKGLTEREEYVIECIYGLKEGKTPITLKNVGRELGITGGGVSTIKLKALRKLRSLARNRKYKITFETEGDEYLTDKERQLIEEIKKNIQLQNGDLSENLGKLKEIQEKARTRKKNKKKEEKKERLDVLDLGLSIRSYNCLKRAGINYLDDLANMTEEQLRKVRNLGKMSFEEIVAKMQEFGISFKTQEQLEKKIIGKQVAVNEGQKKKEINFEDMTQEQLQRMIDENQRIIENNERQIKEDTEKSKLIQRLLEQQQTIDAQQEEINRLRKRLETPQQ